MELWIATSNKDKIKQFQEHCPKECSLKQLIIPEYEIKHPLPEIVSLYKSLPLWKQGIYNVITDDRALLITNGLPGTDIKSFLKSPEIFDRLFQGKTGKLIYSFSFVDKEGIHIYSHYLKIKIVPPSKETGNWGELGRRLAASPYEKPISLYTEEERKQVEQRLSKEIFQPFINMALKIDSEFKKRDPSEIKRINGYFSKIKHGILLKIGEFLDNLERELNPMLMGKVLMSSSRYPVQTFFDLEIKDGFYLEVPYPDQDIKPEGKELLEKLIDYHEQKMKKDRIKEELEEELAKSPGKIKRENGKIMVEREDGEKEELFFREYNDYILKESQISGKKVYALINKDGIPRVFVPIIDMRPYKKSLLLRDGIRNAVEVKIYNTMWKVKGVLPLIFSELSNIYETILINHQPSFSDGTNIYSFNFTPYIIYRKKISSSEKPKGIPLLPSFDMIYPSTRTIHVKWTLGDSNPRPLPCQGSDLPLI